MNLNNQSTPKIENLKIRLLKQIKIESLEYSSIKKQP
jgi:hypothetical protein